MVSKIKQSATHKNSAAAAHLGVPELRVFQVSGEIRVDEAPAKGCVLQQVEKEQRVRIANVEQVLRLPPVLKILYVGDKRGIFSKSLVGQI